MQNTILPSVAFLHASSAQEGGSGRKPRSGGIADDIIAAELNLWIL